ncbi:MAG: hypothetical protein RBT68_06805 [Spirochaetia bacterium]|jgi:hypothetical protein|nr:hypothetical protein [Spirochaetia bacterium]
MKKFQVQVLSLFIVPSVALPAFVQILLQDTFSIAIPDAKPFGMDRVDEDMRKTVDPYTNLIITAVSPMVRIG